MRLGSLRGGWNSRCSTRWSGWRLAGGARRVGLLGQSSIVRWAAASCRREWSARARRILFL
jgi:hypothetical protein